MQKKFLNIKYEYTTVILIVLAAKIIILVFTTFLFDLFYDFRVNSLNIFEIWNIWDAPHYLSIAQLGYQTQGDEANFIVFLPLFPLLVFFFKHVFLVSFLTAGYFVSFVSSILLAIMFYKLIRLDYSSKTAMYGVLLMFIFPTSFFLHIFYTESLFILLSVMCFYFLRKRFYWGAFLTAALASLTRSFGLALIPAMLYEIIKNENLGREKRICYCLAGFLISVSGYLIYLFINYLLWGNPLQFVVFEKQNWHTTFAPLGRGLISAYESIFWRSGLERIMLGYGQILAFVFGLLMSIYVLLRVRISYGIFMSGVLFLSFSMSFWLSMPRYILSLFPMFIPLALFSQKAIFKYLWILFSIILLFFLGIIFIQYGPVF